MDYDSNFTFNFAQKSTAAEQTVEDKHKFEILAKSCRISIRYYHADNKIFASQALKESCIAAQQTQSYCSINTHHQKVLQNEKLEQ